MRSISNTTIKIGLVRIPVKVGNCVSSPESFDTASPDGNPAGKQWYDKITGEAFENDQVKRGVWTEEVFKEISEEDLSAIKEDTKFDDIIIEGFVNEKSIPSERIDNSYYLAAHMDRQTLNTFAKGLKRTKTVAVGRWMPRSRNKLVAIKYLSDGTLLMNTISFKENWHDPDGDVRAHVDETPDKKDLSEMVEIIEKMTDQEEFLDNAQDDVVVLKSQLIQKALVGDKIVSSKSKPEPSPGLSEALEATLQAMKVSEKGSGDGRAKRTSSRKEPSRSTTGRSKRGDSS